MTSETQSPVLEPYLKSLTIGVPQVAGSLAVLPLFNGAMPSLDYALAQEALGAGTLTVTEINESGHVPELWVTNTAEHRVLLLNGEELIGAKQNRILNTSLLLRPKAEGKIPVSCVEQGRWGYRSRTFDSGGYSSIRIRSRTCRDVGRNLRERREARSDQGAVWDAVESHLCELRAPSATMALHDALDAHKESIDQCRESLTYPAGARGVVVAIAGKFAALDLFDKAETLEKVWNRLFAGFLLDVIGLTGPVPAEFPKAKAKAVLTKLGKIPCVPCPSAGMGEDWRFETKTLVGQALVADGVCVHLSAFAG
jgi:hypothetical protein